MSRYCRMSPLAVSCLHSPAVQNRPGKGYPCLPACPAQAGCGYAQVSAQSLHFRSPRSGAGTGKVHGDRHPKISDNVLIGASASILGNIRIGKGAQVGGAACHALPARWLGWCAGGYRPDVASQGIWRSRADAAWGLPVC